MSALDHLPSRPRLADHVAARLHYASGASLVVLHDTRRGILARIGTREWALLRYADGTRDVAGIRAAAVDGTRVDVSELSEITSFFDALHQAGMLGDGPGSALKTANTGALDASRAERPIESLPGYRFVCHGQGACCRQYPTTLFSPLEVARARAVVPERCGAGDDVYGGFTPEFGSSPVAHGAAAVAMCEGACSYLDTDGACSIHREAGARFKPSGCSLYPVVFIDDGETIRATVVPECRCVFDSASEGGEAPLVDAATAAELDASVVVTTVPESIAVDGTRVVARDRYLSWCKEWMDDAENAERVGDVAAGLWTVADSLADRTTEKMPWTSQSGLESSPSIRLFVRTLRNTLERRVGQDEGWRSPGDMVHRVTNEMLVATRTLAEIPDGSLLPAPVSSHHETFYWRTVLYGHQFLGDRPLAETLRWHAVRLWVARQMSRSLPAARLVEDPVWEQPLALVEAVCRAHGLCIAVPIEAIRSK